MAFVSSYGSYSDPNPINGTSSDDEIVLHGGNDVTIEGNRGNDTINIWGGSEVYANGGAGNDNIEVNNVVNTAVYSTIDGGKDDDKISIYNTYVNAIGGAGNDTLYLSTLYNELDHVTLTGGDGNDVFKIAPYVYVSSFSNIV